MIFVADPRQCPTGQHRAALIGNIDVCSVTQYDEIDDPILSPQRPESPV
jgi:hypothetical protein